MSLKHALLAAVSAKPQTGYELSRNIQGSIGYFWSSTHQQIYKELGVLEGEGLLRIKEVLQSDKPDKKIYRISPQGLKELKTWIALEAELPRSKDELLIKLFVGQLVDPKILLNVLSLQSEKRQARLKTYEAIEAEHFKGKALSPEMKFQYLAIRRGILFERSWMEWAQEVKDSLRR